MENVVVEVTVKILEAVVIPVAEGIAGVVVEEITGAAAGITGVVAAITEVTTGILRNAIKRMY